MIKKFIKIKNVGKFKNFAASGDITLDKVNIIYGENSAGKSTLTSVIRSLILNKPELILERKTFGADGDQNIELFFDNGNREQVFKFQNSKWNDWNDDFGNIEIFDEFFINENIYTGLEIQSEHQKCLYHFAMGKEGVGLAGEIEEIKKDLQSNKYPELNSLKEQIGKITKNYFDVETYINLIEDKDIDIKIEEKKQELSVSEASEEIREKAILNEIPPFALPFDLSDLKTLLGKSLSTISEEALQKTIQHIKKLDDVLQKGAESWIHQGLLAVENIKDNKCPFCQQDLEKAKLTIKSYQQYFNEEYRELKESIKQYSRQIEGVNIEQLLNDVKNIDLTNNALLEFWKRFMNIEAPEIRDFEKYYKQIAKYYAEVKLALESKSKSILVSLEINCVDMLFNSISEFNRVIENYNSFVRSLNIQIREIKKRQPNIDELRKAIEKHEIEKQRYSPEIKELCEKYRSIKNEIDGAKKLIDEKREDLKSAISQKVEKYGEETNKFLDKFGTPFKIVKPKPRYKGKGEEPYFEYFLEVEGCEIDPLQKTKFTLSGGDRNAFAVAFFLAKTNADGNIEDKIIIFDDPISSFDTNRERRTIEFIRDLSQKVRQTIVLTHLNTFAFELYDSIRDIGISPKCLQIINRDIKEWDIEEEKKHPFFKNISKLEAFVSGQEEIDLDEARKLIRICLEDKLKFNYFQFFKDLGKECWLGPIVKKLREIKDDSGLKFKYSNKEEVINELGNLCDFSGPSHHSSITTPYKTDYTRDELLNYVKSTLKLIYEWL